ncbi:divergent PAP2 family protein, partial [Haemophilus parainfluenzae]|uniref:divergent PAP2 family protein n=1 Tax=Haemophilus parainfluenzae TaxID=729 RepID=UPI00157EC6DF
MEDLSLILDNHILMVALLACLVAQVLKAVLEFARHRKLNLRVMVETGGMPSSHSALVTALACGIGQTMGWASPAFAITSVFSV